MMEMFKSSFNFIVQFKAIYTTSVGDSNKEE